MSGTSDTVFLELPQAERAEAASALAVLGLASAEASDLQDGEGGGRRLLFVGEDLWRAKSAAARASSSHLAVVLLRPESEASASSILGPEAFDYLVGPAPGWAERAAAYFRALAALLLRFVGHVSILERRYEDLVHSLPDIVYELDSEGRFTFINNSVRLLGYAPSDLLGKHFSILLDEGDAQAVDRDQVLKSFDGVVTGPALSPKLFNERRSIDRRTENLEVRLKRKPGGRDASDMIVTVTSYGEVTAVGEYVSRGQGSDFTGSVGVIRDISLRRKSEEMLRKLYQAVDQLATGILVADRSFRVEYVNPGFIKLSGLDPQQVIGADLTSFFEFGPGEAEELRSLVLGGFDAAAEVRVFAGPGNGGSDPRSGPWAAVSASPVRSPSGLVTHAILICEDISRRKAMEDLVLLSREEARRADAAKGDFLASMSHELKSPVASILAAARLIEMGGPEPERRAASIIASAEGLLGMLGDILDFVRFESGSASLRKYTFPLDGFVAQICDQYRKLAEAKGLAFEADPTPEGNVESDPDHLGRAFAAILDNAVKFTEKGRIRVRAEMERREGNVPYLALSVADTGPGIPAEDQGRIFSAFTQLASPYTKRGGAGIGLALARNIVRALGGEIRLRSELGRGSSFSILVPVGEPAKAVPAQPKTGRSYRLLVVDDNEVNLEYMTAILKNAGHGVLAATGGVEALRLLEDSMPDAALLDIQMPGMSGIELGRKIRSYVGGRYDPGLPLIALTAFDPEDVRRSGVDFDGVFAKPVEVPALFAFIDEAVDRREAPAIDALVEGWKAPTVDGLRSMASARAEVPGLCLALRAAAESGDEEALKAGARSLATALSRLGDERGSAALKRLAFACSGEDRAIVACRAERIIADCGLVLAALGEVLDA